MKFTYPIKSTYVSDWGIQEALRELIANGLDAQAQQGAPFSHSYNPKRKRVILKNLGVRLPLDAFYFGGSDKLGEAGIIGKYGEGLKLAMLVIARSDEHSMTLTNGDEIWTPKLEADKHTGVQCLVVRKKANPVQEADLYVTVNGVSPEDWDGARRRFLALKQDVPFFTNKDGTILNPKEAGSVYVRGVWVQDLPNYKYGYAINADLDTGRDRRLPNLRQLTPAIGELLTDYVLEAQPNTEDRKQRETWLYSLLLAGGGEAQALRDAGLYAFRDAVKSRFVAEHGDSAVPVMSGVAPHILEEWRSLGKTPVVVGQALYEGLMYDYDSIDVVRAELAKQVLITHPENELEASELRTLTRAKAVLTAILESSPVPVPPVYVASFGSPNTLGLYVEGSIFIKRQELADFGGALSTLIHEAAHAAGPDGTLRHLRAIEHLTAAAFNHLTARPSPA